MPNALMEAQVMSFEWKLPEGRALVGTPEAETPVMSPVVSHKHPRTNYSLVAVIVVLMVVAVGAIFCCCYQWVGQLRIQARARSTAHSELAEGTRLSSDPLQDSVGIRSSSGSNPQRASSFSVMMPGDDIPRFVAWTVPGGGIPVASAIPEALHPTSQGPGKLAHNSVVAPVQLCNIPGRVSN